MLVQPVSRRGYKHKHKHDHNDGYQVKPLTCKRRTEAYIGFNNNNLKKEISINNPLFFWEYVPQIDK